MEFHVARAARDRYQFDESLFTFTGTVIFANFHGARVFAQRMNQKRDIVNFPEQAVQASQINAMGLIHELMHVILKQYREQRNPHLLGEMFDALRLDLGEEAIGTLLHGFVDDFPPTVVYRNELTGAVFLDGQTDGLSHYEAMLEELFMLWLSNINPAFAPFIELFDDARLEKETVYPQAITSIQRFFSSQPGFGALGQNLLDVLLAPMRAAPHSLEGQLEFMRQQWGAVLGRHIYRLLSSLDLIKEEARLFMVVGPGGPGPTPIPFYRRGDELPETENFSADREWMPRLVLIAKNAYVWLDQLSKQYGRPLRTLADIPDQELDLLADWGVTGLWLIGLWERSSASQRVKQIMGNPDAVASAYSLYDYQIASALGGEESCRVLRERAWQRGIRLASDMVPNHVGIDGRWVYEHPEWFISSGYSPFPAYSFNGPDLSSDSRVGLFLEDHYYNRTDAAVVFKRVDRWSGSEIYIYHGNDGTSMPWNDTAQLNYLHSEVREAVIQTILHVARQFPIIRFDAAMTLAKKHYQRLWFPEPGTGGDIASRSDFGMTREQFDALMPQEFWREVVDRAAVEAPDTLLLAEAFWLMESYFVRTLGMHRVYNSAFMHILRDEDNAKYRLLMKNTLEFDPEILKRYVNFMNNPDERTAVDQFGKGDKYFGICTLMVTLPGLPMFGHGQIEGFAEKYGMEYQRAYWEEQPDGYLIDRHKREIFPLMHRRYLFAGVEHFLLYDLFTADGGVNEDVFALSNRYGDERGLVLYHNRYNTARGWLRSSAAYAVKTGQGDERRLVQRTLAEGLDLPNDQEMFCIFRDQVSGLEFIRSSSALVEQGLYVELEAYQCHVLLDWRIVRDDATRRYADLCSYLNGRGVPSIDDAVRETFLQPVHRPLRALINASSFRKLTDAWHSHTGAALPAAWAKQLDHTTPDGLEEEHLPSLSNGADGVEEEHLPPSGNGAGTSGQPRGLGYEVADQLRSALTAISAFFGFSGDPAAIVRLVSRELRVILGLSASVPQEDDAPAGYYAARDDVRQRLSKADLGQWGSLWSWLFIHELGRLVDDQDVAQQSRSLIDEWLLGRVITGALGGLGLDEYAAVHALGRVKWLTSQQCWFELHDADQPYQILEDWLADDIVRQLIGVNRAQGVLWFNKEAFEQLLGWMLLVAVVRVEASTSRTVAERRATLAACYATIQHMRDAADQSDYQVEKLLEVV